MSGLAFSNLFNQSESKYHVNTGQQIIGFGRVEEVYLDRVKIKVGAKDNEKEIVAPVGAIRFREINTPMQIGNTSSNYLPIAIPLNLSIMKIPLINEIVPLYSAPTFNTDTEIQDVLSTNITSYYGESISIYQSLEHNALPNEVEYKGNINLDNTKTFKESGLIQSLVAMPGDILIQGRHGQSLRFTYVVPDLIDNLKKQKVLVNDPLTILSNGQSPTKGSPGFATLVENINTDPSSIYLSSTQKIPLNQIVKFSTTYDKSILPKESVAHTTPQIILNSDRVHLNARKDSILLTAFKSIGLASKIVAIESETYVCLDALRGEIYLGALAREQREKVRGSGNSSKVGEPGVLGNSLKSWLESLLDNLDILNQGLQALSVEPASAIGQLIGLGATLSQITPTLKQQISTILSEKVYLE